MTQQAYPTEKCVACPAQIVWAVTAANAKWMPVNPEPGVKGGNVALTPGPPGQPPVATVLGVAKQFGRTNLRTSHFVDCPRAAELRRRGRP